MTTNATKMLVIGKATGVYGIKGWIKIHSFTEPMENFIGYGNYYLERADQWEPIDFDQIKIHNKGLVGQIEGVDNREQAIHFCKCNIAIPIDDLATLEDNQFYWHQLEGMQVWTVLSEGTEVLLGTLDHMMETGANDVLVVKANNNSIDKRERLIPYLPEQVITNIDLDAGIIKVDWDPEF